MEAVRLEAVLRERFGDFAWLYETGAFAGAADITRAYLGLGAGTPLPFVFPHGVDTGENREPEDVYRAEPIYLAVRDDIAAVARLTKPTLLFPHPWLMLPLAPPPEAPRGTLFIGTPSGPDNNEHLFQGIQRLDLPKPWGIMLKFRGLDPADFAWWRERGFETHTAGPATSTDFYPNQRAVLARYRVVAVSYLSSIAVFASLLRRQLVLVPGVTHQFVTDADSDFIRHEVRADVHEIWGRLLSDDPEVRGREAERLLGAAYLDVPERMRARIHEAISRLDQPFHLPALTRRLGRKAGTALLRRRIPVQKLLPNPFAALSRKLAWRMGWSKVGVISGDELAHFGLTEGEPYKFFTCRSSEVGTRIGLGEGPKKRVAPKP